MDTRRLPLILPVLAFGLAACGSSSAPVAGGAGTTSPPAQGATPTHADCGVTIDDVKALAPTNVTVTVRNRSDQPPTDCDWYWTDRSAGIGKDPGDVHVSFGAGDRKGMEEGLETGAYGDLKDLPGVGDKAFIVGSARFVQVIGLKGQAAVNIQVRNIEQTKATEVATMAAKRSLGG